jgi:predicted 3-demethylubiquinone-9 3-methyltransferase (glyoxalase superfamily)
MQKIIPFLWFDNNAEEAIEFYTSIFKNSKIISIRRQGKNGPVFTATFRLEGQTFYALNGGPHFKFTEAISLFVNCKTQREVKYGLSWQIIPTVLGKLLSDPDPVKSHRVMQAMLQMKKINIKKLQQAYKY